VLEDAPRPQRRGLLVLRNSHALALQVGRALDAGVLADEDAGVEEPARREDRQADPPIVAGGHRHNERGERHLRHVEIAELELAPEEFGGVDRAGDELNAVIHDIVYSLDGSVSAEHGVGRLKVDEIAHYKPGPEMDMMRAVKRALDPDGMMNPGKVVA